MHRRKFLTLAAGSLLLKTWQARADHHVVSVDPWFVEFDLKSLTGRDTSVADFYIRNHFAEPRVSGEKRLRIEGEVKNAQDVTESGLRQLSEHPLGAVLECAGNLVETDALVSNGIWEGWRLRDILALAGPTAKGLHVHLYGEDGYARSVPVDRVLDGGMLVTRLNGQPLTLVHGAPWRAFFPGWYGMDSIKWLNRLVLSASPLPDNMKDYIEVLKRTSGQTIRRPLPPVQVKSLITSPAGGSVLPRGPARIHGLAWSGGAKITGVEVNDSITNRWIPASLSLGGRYEWALWGATLDLTRPGAVELACRARDASGSTQPERRDPRRVDYYAANWYHRIQCIVT
ncbi:MAG TPA: molybdopterin-dependent oxidoreductase [Terriglobia bacterium]|nr:molybdopterin-dependent oxidoreductase [Terriglobia bacterium]